VVGVGVTAALLWLGLALAWPVLGESGRPTGREVDVHAVFAASELPVAPVLTDPTALGRVARRTAEALRACAHPVRCRQVGALAELGVELERVVRTLELVAETAEEDARTGQSRLTDPAWIRQHFEVFRWRPDREAASSRKVTVTDASIRLTKYLVYQVSGSPVRTDTYDTALYGVVGEDDAWTAYTRIDAYAGVFEAGGAGEGLLKPLVYLTREGVNRALMQGTVEVTLPDGSTKLYNVHRNNGVAWKPEEKDGNKQERYWSFQEQPGIVGVEGVLLEPGVSVAGDIHNVGFGKLVALHTPDGLRLAVLADTGGAFQPNLFQLDWLAGTFPSHAAYLEGVAHLPKRVEASVLVVR
jgi:hypothetical protein